MLKKFMCYFRPLDLIDSRVHTKGGRARTRLLRRVLRRVLETAFEKVLRRVLRSVLQWALQEGRVLRRVLQRGSKKRLSRQKHVFSRVRHPLRAPQTGPVCAKTGLIGPGLRPAAPALHVWVFGEGADSARGVAAIVVCRRNSSCNSSCDAIVRNGRRTIALFLLFQVQ